MAQQQQITHTPRWLPTIDRPEWSLVLPPSFTSSTTLHKFPVEMLDIARQSNRNLWHELLLFSTLFWHCQRTPERIQLCPLCPVVPTVLLQLEMTFLMSLWLCNLDFIAIIRKKLQVPNEVAHTLCAASVHMSPPQCNPCPSHSSSLHPILFSGSCWFLCKCWCRRGN